MPLQEQKYTKSGAKLALWSIDEPMEALAAQLDYFPFSPFKSEQRNLQWLASRLALQCLLQESGFHKAECRLMYTPLGKPVLADLSWDLSLSHSGSLAAAMLGPQPLGMDTERISQRIHRIRHKFVNEEEEAWLKDSPEADLGLHLIWSAKETLFKYYGAGEVDFRKNLLVLPLGPNLLKGIIRKEHYQQELELAYEVIDREYVLTYTL